MEFFLILAAVGRDLDISFLLCEHSDSIDYLMTNIFDFWQIIHKQTTYYTYVCVFLTLLP